MISPDDVAYYARFNTLKLIKPKSKTLQPLTFVDGSAFVSIFIYTTRKLTIVSRANVIPLPLLYGSLYFFVFTMVISCERCVEMEMHFMEYFELSRNIF